MFLRLLTVYLFIHLPLLGGHTFGIAERVQEQMTGIDVSHHQKRIDWDRVTRRNTVHFAFIKATEGADFTDSLFCYNWQSVAQTPIRRGAYHFFRPRSSGYLQALHYLATVDFQDGDLRPVLDVEVTDNVPPHILLEEMRIWLLTVERALNVRPIIYSNQDFYDRYLAGLFDHYPLWVARYSWEQPVLSTGRRWDCWQYSNEGNVEGIPGHVDLNVFPGNREMFEQRLVWNAPPSALTPAAP